MTAETKPEAKPQSFSLAVGESVVLRPEGRDAAGNAYRVPWPAAWSTLAEKQVRLEPRPDGTALATAVKEGTASVVLAAGPFVTTFWVAVVPSPITSVVAVAGPVVTTNLSAGSYAYAGTNDATEWLKKREAKPA